MQSKWCALENNDGDYTNYRIHELGSLALGHLTNIFDEWPIIEFFNCTQARNGGPIGKSNSLHQSLVMRNNITN